MNKKKMLQMNFAKDWRGGERQTLYNMMGFRNAGYDVSLLCRKNCQLEIKSKAEGFKTFAFKNIFGAIFFFIFKCRKYFVLHAQSSHILTYAVFTKVFHGAKIIFTRRIDNAPSGKITKWKYLQADKIIVISEAVKDVIEKFVNEKVIVISDIGIEKKLNEIHAKKLLENKKINPETFIIATTAALTKDKAPAVMLEAIHILASKIKNFVFLHFGNGPLELEIAELIKKYKLNDVYYLMGFTENVEDIFSIINIFTMSSEMEGLGSSVLDAFLYHVPVVSTDAGGLPELLKDERGILCKKNSPESLAAGIIEIFTNAALQNKITTNAFTYVKQFHSLQYITHQYIEVLNSL